MPINTETEDVRWFKRLARELHERRNGRRGHLTYDRRLARSNGIRPGLDLLADYHRGDPPLTDVHQDWAAAFRQFLRMGRLNVAGLLVSSTQNRMTLRDFRTAEAEDEVGDEKARDIMRANKLKTISRDVHEWTLALGDAYALVQPPSSKTGQWALITAEDPREVITIDDSATGRPKIGLKMFRDEWDSEDHAYLYLPNGDIRFARKKGATSITHNTMFRFNPKQWEWDEEKDQKTPGGRFPLVHFRNYHGTGEFEEHLNALDRINDKIYNEWWISKIQAFRQRAIIADEEEDEDGEPIDYDPDVFVASPDAMWKLPMGAKMWESSSLDMSSITGAIQKDLQWLAAVTSQPLHTITPDAANGSAEGASLMREEHLYKIADRIDRVDPGWAEVMSLAFHFQDDEARADVTKLEPLWGPIERYSLQQKASAAAQLNAGERPALPRERIWVEVLQIPPAEVPVLREQAGRDLLFGGAGGQLGPVSPLPGEQPPEQRPPAAG